MTFVFDLSKPATAIALLLGSACPTMACPPVTPYPPLMQEQGETSEEFERRVEARTDALRRLTELQAARTAGFDHGYEVALWDSTPRIFLVESIGDVDRVEFRYRDRGMVVTRPGKRLRIVQSVRGHTDTATVDITHKEVSSCQRDGFASAVEGETGTRFIMFATDEPLSMSSIIEIYSEAEVITGHSRSVFGAN